MPRTTRRATFRYHFATGYTDLCPDCSAVLQREGEVAGDPREASVTLDGLLRAVPAPLAQPCATCEGLEAYEDELNASRAACHDTAFGSPAEHARWHAIHDTPTLAEVEGDDDPRYDDSAPDCDPDGYVPGQTAPEVLDAMRAEREGRLGDMCDSEYVWS